ncbi:MAG: anthranilate synthase component I family protein [Bacteroidota bacterium]
MREQIVFEIDNVIFFKEKLLHYAKNMERFCVLNSNEWQNCNNEMIVAMDSIDEIIPSWNSFDALKKFHKEKNDWLFGFLSYDLKNEIENLSSENFDGIGFPQIHFFQPKYVFIIRNNKVEISFLPEHSNEQEVENIFEEIINQLPITDYQLPITEIKSRVSKEEYISIINRIKNHIKRGDIYEMNYCIEFFATNSWINPSEVFLKLNETSQTPFSAFYRMNDTYLMCASPERFLKKDGRKIISQPIKGTARRGKTSTEDLELKELLSRNEKEKSENVMIVDLVRNDLSRTCDNVKVEELFGVYAFKQLHLMISTVSGEMHKDIHFMDLIKNAFPMGSMTGAPKVRAMELIEQFEKTKRGLYSGAVGYITPDGNFDFNVVIRSILYNSSSKYLSFQVGSAITANSISENEYEECLLKAKGMFEALGVSLKQLSVNR